MVLELAVGIAIAFIIGSIPSAVWIGKALYQIDVREHGSGNPGATNTFRVLGKRAGTLVMLSDIIKGLIVTLIALALVRKGILPENNLVVIQLVFGLTAVMGHIFSIFINFKGGKGVATLLGMMLGIHPEAALASAGVFLVILIFSKYVSLGSILGVLSFPLFLLLVPRFRMGEPILLIFAFLLVVLVVWTHHKNIRRIIDGNERKTYLIRKK